MLEFLKRLFNSRIKATDTTGAIKCAKDVDGKNPRRRYYGKLAWLIRQGVPLPEAKRKAAGYAGGKQVPEKGDGGDYTMPYRNINELPQQVRDALPAEAQKIWLDAYNAAHNDGEDESTAASIAWQAVKNAGWKKEDGNWVKASEPQKVHGMVDLAGVTFDEYMPDPQNPDRVELVSEIQIMRTGSWNHPLYGKFTIKDEDMDLFVKHFYENVRGVDLAVDQEHVPGGGAAGWFKDVFKRGNTLWAKIAWTPLGAQLIKDKVYRYFSPEFDFDYKDPETGQKYRCVLYGGALTNRPFIKGMEPIMLSEDVAQEILDALKYNFLKGGEPAEPEPGPGNQDPGNSRKGETELKLSELIKLFGWPEDTTEEQAKQKLAEMAQGNDNAGDGGSDGGDEPEGGNMNLAETVTKLSERVKALEKENGDLKAKALNERWNRVCQDAFKDGRLTQKLAEKFKPMFVADPDGTEEIIKNLPKAVPNPQGNDGGGNGGGGPVQLSETHKAICQQMGVDPELVVKYNPDLANNQGE